MANRILMVTLCARTIVGRSSFVAALPGRLAFLWNKILALLAGDESELACCREAVDIRIVAEPRFDTNIAGGRNPPEVARFPQAPGRRMPSRESGANRRRDGQPSVCGFGSPQETRFDLAIKEFKMAVQQNKKSPSKRGMRRAHDFLTNPPLAVEPITGEVHLRHHISPSGYYRGKKVAKGKGE